MLPVNRTLMLVLLVRIVSGCAPDSPSDCPEVDPVFSLPLDEAPHTGTMEWWYYTGHVWTAGDRRYGFDYSFFQVVH